MSCKTPTGHGEWGWLTVLTLHNANVIDNAAGPKPVLKGARGQRLESLLSLLKPVQAISEYLSTEAATTSFNVYLNWASQQTFDCKRR